VLAFPSTYTVGITSLGYQVVWATLAQRADVDVRRLFTDQGDPAHGGNRGRGPDLDLFGLSLSWELDGPVLLDLLEQCRIPVWAVERGDGDPIVFGGGPVLTANPEPLAPFFDAWLLGEGEEPITSPSEALSAPLNRAAIAELITRLRTCINDGDMEADWLLSQNEVALREALGSRYDGCRQALAAFDFAAAAEALAEA
jgi:hypothetical protein